MTQINFRSAVPDDLPVLCEFEQGVIDAERPFDPTLQEGHINYYDIRAMIESSDTEVIVAVIKDQLVASAYVTVKKAKPYLQFAHFAYVGFMYVKPEFRGKGISQQVIEELMNWARSRGLDEMRLDVYEDNQSAVRAYEKCGFQKHLVEMRMTI